MNKRGRSAYLLESLEARLLFSADLAPLPVDGGLSGPEVESDLEVSLRPDSGSLQESDTDEHLRLEIIFVDEAVDYYQQLISDLESQLENGRRFNVVALDSEHDGIAQISAYLNQHQDIAAVHIISHGTDGEVVLGNSRLNTTTLDDYAEAIEGWQRSLSSDADLLFYGCNLAAGNEGQDLINTITLLTGADVAASDDPTGSAKLGGDWVLEYDKGEIETPVAVNPETQHNWNCVLATFAVNTTADTVDANPGDGLAQDASGNTSLRAAIMETNALGGASDITLNPGTYTLSLGELDITNDLTINGADARTTLIDGDGSDRVFKIDNNSTATLNGITIMNGNKNGSGGVRVEGGSTLYLSDAIVRDNTSDMGGGIHVHGTAYLERVLFYNNTANEGGAIHFHGADGGSLINVTISGNDATSEGGGLWTDTPITVTNSTIAYNTAPDGGGVFDKDGLEITLANSILYNPGSTNANQSLTSGDFNIDSDGSALLGLGNDRVVDPVVNPFLAPLADNGGTTPTHALLATSVDAIDRVGLGGAPSLDGRGAARDGLPDIGAYEYSARTTGAVDEFLVNDGYETGSQETSGDVDHSQRAVALADDGSYVVVWSSDGQDAFGWGVYAQRFDKLGNELTGEILVNEIESGNEQWARVVSDSNGNFVVTWTSGHAGSIDVYARRFDSTGAALGGEFRVNTTTANDQQDSSIAMDASGNFVVVWEGYDPVDSAAVFYRRFYANGTAMDATEMRANIMDDGTERDASVAMNATGDFVVVWEEGGHIKFQMFASDGTPGTASTVYIDTVSSNPDVAMDAIGNFVVVYRWNGASGRGIWGHQFDNTGTEQPPWFRVGPGNNTVNKDHNNPSITMDDLGNFIVTYESTAEGGPGETVFAARFQSDKTSLGEFQVNQTTAGDQHMASIAMLDLDNYVVAFTGDDVDQTGVFARQYGTAVFNNAPTATNLTTTSAYNEGDASVAITDIVVSDVDTAETITATLTLNDTSTGSLSANDGATYDGGTGEWTITDTVANVNTALAGLVFTPNVNNDVDTTISVDIDDGDEDGSGPLTGTITLDVTPANDAPTATNLTTTSAYNEGDASVAITDIVVSDVDTAETITATLTLNDTSTGSLSANDGATYDGGTGEWTITDTVANVNTALAGLVFTPNVNNDVDTTISVDIDDGDEDGSGPLTGTITLDVTPANDAPTATNLTTTSAYNEGDASVAITDIVVSDVDTAETITVTLTLNDTSTGSLSANDGATYDGGTGEWTITDTVANVNTALAGLVFTPNVNNDVDTTISVDIDDGDEDGSGPLTGTITLDVTPANDAPTATNLTTTSAYNEGDASVAITDIVVSDVDTAETITATLTLNDTSTGSLSANDGATYDGGTGEWTITDTVANVNTALAGLVFTPNVNNDVDTTISVDIDDGDEDGSGPLTGTITLDVTPANDAPTATNLTTTSAYNEGDASVAITDIVVSDVDTAETITATLTLNDTSTGSLSANDGATYDGGTGEWTITDTVANVNTALAGLVFTPNVNNDVDTTISVDIDDGDEDGSGPLTGTITLDVTPANDAPTATNLTTTSAYNEGDASVAITDIVVSDVDTAETITVTLTLNDTSTGSLSANDGATYDGGTGEWTITDTVANVNTALAGLVFTPNVNNDVDTTISVDIDDGDEDGSGPLTGTITLDVTPANDAPTATNLTTTSAYNEGDASVAITDIVVSDVDTAETITATLTLNDTSTGSLSANDGATYDGGTGEWTITDTVANVNTALAGLVFTPNVNNDVDTTISVDIDDGDEDGSGPLTGTITLDVTPANNPPVAVDDNLNATEDNSITFASATALLGNDSDIDGDTPTMTGTTQPANGLLVDNGDGTLTYTPNSNFQGIDSFTYSIGDGNGGTATARAMIVVSPVGDTPQVTNVSTFSDVQSGLIFIDRHASDGSEVTHFKISGITNGTLYFADGVTQINNGVYITVAQGQAGVRFTPADNSTADGSFNVESSEDGVSVASQSGMATSIITLLAPASPPSDPDPGPPPEDPVEEVSEEDVPEESEVAEDAAAETGFPADTNNMIAVKPTQSLMAPNTAKPSLDSGVSNFSRADFDRHNDKTPNGSIHLSPQKLKMLFETKNLGELKAALGKLDITTLSPADYELVRGSLDAIKEEMGQEIMLGKTVLGSAIATSVGLSAGYVVWMLKGGSLLASVLSSLPAWQLADPLAILVGKKDEDGDDDESLETIIEDGSGRDGDKDSKASEPQNVKKESKQR